MAVYRYAHLPTPNALRLRRNIAIGFGLCATALAGAFWIPFSWASWVGAAAFSGSVFFGMLLWTAHRLVRRMREGKWQYELELGPDGLTRRSQGHTMHLGHPELLGYSQNHAGTRLTVRTGDRLRQIAVSSELTSLESLRAELQGMGLAEIPSQTWGWRFWARVLIPWTIMLASGVVAVASSRPAWIISSAALFLVAYAASLFWYPACLTGVWVFRRALWRWMLLWAVFASVVIYLQLAAGLPLPPHSYAVLAAGYMVCLTVLVWDFWRRRSHKPAASSPQP